jgi:hypothetical protein
VGTLPPARRAAEAKDAVEVVPPAENVTEDPAVSICHFVID